MSGTDPAAYAASLAAPATPSPVPAAAPVEAPVAAAESAPPPTPVAEAPAPAVTPVTTLLGETPQPETAPITEVAPEAPVEANVAPLSEEPAPAPTYEPFALPEGVTLEAEQLGNFTGLLAELEATGKADHAAVQQFGQKAVDLFIAETTKAVEAHNAANVAWWEAEKARWKDEVISHPELGGNRLRTTLDAANRAILRLPQEKQAAFRGVLEQSGYGNHPVVVDVLATLGNLLSEGRPLAAMKPPAPPTSKAGKLYGTSMRA